MDITQLCSRLRIEQDQDDVIPRRTRTQPQPVGPQHNCVRELYMSGSHKLAAAKHQHSGYYQPGQAYHKRYENMAHFAERHAR